MALKSKQIEALKDADLVVDRIYEGGRSGNAGDDPLVPLLGVSNQGGFRILGKVKGSIKLLLVTTSMSEPDWPDSLDAQTGRFVYYGDNREPGQELHSTRRWGNELLSRIFAASHEGAGGRRTVPPIFVFQKAGVYRDARFLGLAVPGAVDLAETEDLVAIWRSVSGRRFQNYKSAFTILDVSKISRSWINDIQSGTPFSENAPTVWLDWVKSGKYQPLKAPPIVQYRTKDEQLPRSASEKAILQTIAAWFDGYPFDFERFAGKVCEMMLPGVTQLDLTRPSRDGGRDGIGKYRIGTPAGAVEVEFALEAKCYAPGKTSVKVRDTSRLISRLRYRQFGVLVTTSFVAKQAYEEIQEDQHPVLIIAGVDIVRELQKKGFRDRRAVADWLELGFPHD